MRRDLAPEYGWRSRAASLIAGCAVWEMLARLVASPFFPPCSATFRALIDLLQRGVILGSLTISLTNLALGFGGAALAGVALGIAMARVRQVELFVEPYLHALLAAPGIVYVPLLFTVFGASRATQVGSVFLHALFVIVATTAGALRAKNEGLMAMAKAFGASDGQIFWSIRWPAALPVVVSGLRVGALHGVKGMINGEMFIAFTGLGALVRTYGARFEADRVLAILIVIVVIAFGCTALIDLLARQSTRTMEARA